MTKKLPDNWITGGKHFVEHVSGRWRVSKARIKERWAYTLWKRIRASGGTQAHWGLYGNYDSIEEADGVVQNPPPHRLNRR